MPLVYDETATSVQRRAVAALMYDLGVMSQASYNTAAAGGTGALTHIAVQGLLEHMRYDKRAELRYRDWGIPAAQWDEAIRRELRENGPVLYSGASEDAGHQFVIDGCTSTDYFHVNWGWGGYADEYFLLSALDPDGVGTGGGSGDGFDFGQSAVVGLRKDETGTSTYSDLLLVGTGEGNDQVTYHGLSARSAKRSARRSTSTHWAPTPASDGRESAARSPVRSAPATASACATRGPKGSGSGPTAATGRPSSSSCCATIPRPGRSNRSTRPPRWRSTARAVC